MKSRQFFPGCDSGGGKVAVKTSEILLCRPVHWSRAMLGVLVGVGVIVAVIVVEGDTVILLCPTLVVVVV